MNREIANRFLEVFAPDKDDPFQQRIPIVPSIGNNDVYPHNIMEAGPNRILQHFSEIWAEFIPESQYHTFQHGGYYTAEVVPGKIAVVALNTLYFFNQNAAVDGCDSDDEPGTDQMDWLEVELESMRKRGMTAYLTGHVPPARKSYSDSCFIRYTDIALRFQDVIVGHLYGHANIDHFFILSQATLKGSEFELPSEEEIPHTEEPENSNTATVGFMGKNKSVCGDKSFEYEYDQFHYMGLSSYLLELWEQYEDIPKKKVKLSDYAIVLVSPSVVPTYNPSLRVYSYQLATEKSQDELLTVSPSEELDGSQAESFEDEAGDLDNEVEQEEEEESLWSGFVAQRYGHNVDNNYNNGKKKKKKPKKPKKPKRPPNPPAVPPSAFGFPLHYTQYWVNLTLANLEKKQPEYVVEYRSKEDWGLQDLSVPGWLALARKVVTDDRVKEQYLARMVVLTGTENDHF
ncbi:Endopolyphosphatase [Lobosporangium transversale]|nr:Endopolyphosphatase [Lobosporangium transversale]